MNIKRAAGMAFLTYLTSLLMGMITMSLLGISPSQNSVIPNSVLIINIAVTVVIAIFFTQFYFKNKKINQNAKEGLLFGVMLIFVGFVLDIVAFSMYSIISGSQQSILDYYSNPLFWIALVILLGTTTIVGSLKRRRK